MSDLSQLKVTRGSRVSLQEQILRALLQKIDDGT